MLTLLALTDGPNIAVDRRDIMIGRHPACDAQVTSPWISLRHCVVTGTGREIVVRDLGSTNGTWINGTRVKVGRLKPGDEMTIGHFRYRLAPAAQDDATMHGLCDDSQSD